MRTPISGLLIAALSVGTVAAQGQTPAQEGELVLQGETTPRPALPSYYGDTGIWFLPTAETLPSGKWSLSVYRANFDRHQGLTDVGELGITAAVGLGDRVEVFGSWRIGRFQRNVSPVFVPSDTEYGGVLHEQPYNAGGWSKNLGEPIVAGAKFSILSQSRGNGVSLSPRVMIKFPSGGATEASTKAFAGDFSLVLSKEISESFEATGVVGAILRGSPDEFDLPSGMRWGVGAAFPSRSPLRALVELEGEAVGGEVTLNSPLIGRDGSVAPLVSETPNPAALKFGAVWQAPSGIFVHGGANYSFGTGDRVVGGTPIEQNAWGLDVRIGWHPGVTPPREWVRVAREEPPPPPRPTPPPPPAANRNPTFNVAAACDPCTVQANGTSRLSAQATDPDGDAVTYRWSAPRGTFAPADAANSTWTAPGVAGPVVATVTASDGRGGTATSTVTLTVVAREIVFEDVHFEFDRFNLTDEAIQILAAAVTVLQENPDLNVTIEGHTDFIGTSEYNLALGERRAGSVRDYLQSRGIAAGRLRTVSFGEDRPIADNNTDAGRAMNRRAVIVRME